MESLKIDVRGLDLEEKQKVVCLFNDLGFVNGHKSIGFYTFLYGCFDTKNGYAGTLQFGNTAKTFGNSKFKEVTIPELRDMVVLKRNDVGDATHEDGFDGKYRQFNNVWYWFNIGKWKISEQNWHYHNKLLKPIEKTEMKLKECLVKNMVTGGYDQFAKYDLHESDIEIPEGADIALSGGGSSIYFYKENDYYFNGTGWRNCAADSIKTVKAYIDTGATVLWQRSDIDYFNPNHKKEWTQKVLSKVPNDLILDEFKQPGIIKVLRENLKDLDCAFNDALFFGAGYLKINLDQSVNRIDPKKVLITDFDADKVFKNPEDLPFIDNEIKIDVIGCVENLPEFKPEFPTEKEIKTDFPLNRGDVNYRVAKAFNEIRGTDLTEDDLDYLRKLIDLTVSHYTDRF